MHSQQLSLHCTFSTCDPWFATLLHPTRWCSVQDILPPSGRLTGARCLGFACLYARLSHATCGAALICSNCRPYLQYASVYAVTTDISLFFNRAVPPSAAPQRYSPGMLFLNYLAKIRQFSWSSIAAVQFSGLIVVAYSPSHFHAGYGYCYGCSYACGAVCRFRSQVFYLILARAPPSRS